ncbi:uncharacterized protein [Drosophila takahashii]|uniref:uncharacterized protein n=1 Tax=Drosophila takahashii TaxID=29030 RepID=UPI001CF82A04|nr:uncharacterized protein LOC108055237 [Drosophila takahashii]
MEHKNKKDRSIFLEREERVSIGGRQRIYIKKTHKKVRELFRHPTVGVSSYAHKQPEVGPSSSSLGLEKIQRTRQQVDILYRKIENEINKLKDFRNHFLKDTDTGSRSRSPDMAKARQKNMTWGQSLEANQVGPLAANRTPNSGPQPKVKCRTIAVKNSPAIDSSEIDQRISGGCSHCCANCSRNYQTIYQSSFGNCNCHCNCSCQCNMGYPQQFSVCNKFNGGISPNQGMEFGIPYSICPRQTCGRVVTDLNTQGIGRNWCPKIMTDRAASPKDCRTKCQDKKSPVRSGKSTIIKRLECKIKAETAAASLAQQKKTPEKLPKVIQKKENESSEDHKQNKTKMKSENVTVSKLVTSKAFSGDADPSKLCSEEQTDETKVRMYQDYLNQYKQENSRTELEGRTALQPIPTYTRIKTEVEQKPNVKQPADSPPLSDSDGIKNQEKGNSKGVQEVEESNCCCDAGRNALVSQSSSDERLISVENLCCCNISEDGKTGGNMQDSKSHSERSHTYKNVSQDWHNNDGRCNEKDYSTPESRKQPTDKRYFNDSRPVASWNNTNGLQCPDDRSLLKTKSAAKANRMNSEKSKKFESMNSKMVTQERREHSKERISVKTVPKEMRAHNLQRSTSPQVLRTTSYVSMAPQYQKDIPVIQAHRDAIKTQKNITCREKLEKQHYYRDHVNPTLPSTSRLENFPSEVIASPQSESAETVLKIPNQYSRSNNCDNDSLHDRFVNCYQDLKQDTLRNFEPLEKIASYKSDNGYIYNESDYDALACRQDDLREPSYRIPEKTQKSHDDSPHVSYKQSIKRNPQTPPNRQDSPRNPKDYYRQVNQKPQNEYNSQILNTRSHSPNRPYRVNDQTSSSHCCPSPSQSDQSLCSECQESYKTQKKVQSVDHFKTYSYDDCDRGHHTKYGSSPDQINYRYDGYEGDQLENHRQVHNQHTPRSCMSSPRRCSRSEDSQVPVLETVCEKRTRTVTFEDNSGDLTKEEHVKETCHSLIDWERALKYHMVEQSGDTENTDDNYTCRSSSSGERTCLESTYDDDFASCEEADPQTNYKRAPAFDGCPCMYQTYLNLASMCQNEGRSIQR